MLSSQIFFSVLTCRVFSDRGTHNNISIVFYISFNVRACMSVLSLAGNDDDFLLSSLSLLGKYYSTIKIQPK